MYDLTLCTSVGDTHHNVQLLAAADRELVIDMFTHLKRKLELALGHPDEKTGTFGLSLVRWHETPARPGAGICLFMSEA